MERAEARRAHLRISTVEVKRAVIGSERRPTHPRSVSNTGAEKVRLLGEVTEQAESWDHPRWVIGKAEVLAKGPPTRCVVTTRADPPEALCAWDVQRGEREHGSKDLNLACRPSDYRFGANQLHSMADV